MSEPHCYECKTTEEVELWPLISTKILVPLCGPCRGKLSYVFQSVEKAVFKKDKPKKESSIWPGIFMVVMILFGLTYWILYVLGVFK